MQKMQRHNAPTTNGNADINPAKCMFHLGNLMLVLALVHTCNVHEAVRDSRP